MAKILQPMATAVADRRNAAALRTRWTGATRSMTATAILGLLAVVLALPSARADILRMPDGSLSVEVRPELPANGTPQSQVLARFGEPNRRHPTVGGGRPQHPPITRWDYDDFSVVFERQIVKHTVVRSAAR